MISHGDVGRHVGNDLSVSATWVDNSGHSRAIACALMCHHLDSQICLDSSRASSLVGYKACQDVLAMPIEASSIGHGKSASSMVDFPLPCCLPEGIHHYQPVKDIINHYHAFLTIILTRDWPSLFTHINHL